MIGKPSHLLKHKLGSSGTLIQNTITSEIYQDGSRYDGEMKGELRHGHGKLFYSDGTWFEGSWILDRIEGFGVFYSSSNKLSYEGEWSHNKRNGQGVMINEFPQDMEESHFQRTFDKKENTWVRYEGEFHNDEWNGVGKLIFSNGETYQGTFKKGMMHGKGSFNKGKRMVLAGEWKNNALIQLF